MAERRFLLVDADVLPEVFVKVLQAKELLASGAVSNISAAAKQAGISAAGASIVTITQSRPENGAAQVEVTVRTGTMQMPVDEMLTRLSHQPCVVEIHRGA